MTEADLINTINELYWRGWSYDEIVKHLNVPWALVINYLEVDYYE